MNNRKTRGKARGKAQGKARRKTQRKARGSPRKNSYNKKNHGKNAGSSNGLLSHSSLKILLKMRNASSSDRLAFFERLIDLYKNKENKLRFESLANSLRRNISPFKSEPNRVLDKINDNEIRKLVTEISKIVEQELAFNKKGGARREIRSLRDLTICELAICIIIYLGKGIAVLTIVYLSLLTLCGGDHECATRHMEGIGNVLNFINDMIFAYEHPIASSILDLI